MISNIYQYYCPLNIVDLFGGDPMDPAKLTVVNSTRITFRLTPNYDLVPFFVDNKAKPWYTFRCESCLCYLNRDFDTRIFDPSKELPYEVEQDMLRHAKDHQYFGSWGIQVYKQERKNIEAASNIKK